MDMHMIQWRNQHESDQQKSQQQYVKIPKLLTDPYRQASSAVPLFAPEPKAKISSLSGIFADSPIRFPSVARVGCYFSLAQRQELELQTLIYKYIVAGAAVPPELLHRIWISLVHCRSNFLHHYSNTYQPALLQSRYWRRAMDPEPGRCRRTDGKKWRCSRDVVAGQKYCERHVRRGRNHSRKSVEMSTPNDTITTTFDGALGSGALEATTTTVSPPAAVANGPKFNLSGPSSSINLLHANQSSSDSKTEHKGLFEAQNDLRHFFDDWPLSLQQSNNAGRSNANSIKSNLCLSISMPGNSSSNVSLKLSTGTMDEQGPRDSRSEQLQLNWTASMGGPLAEALRSTSDSFPTSILH